jgi:hypothetical protein
MRKKSRRKIFGAWRKRERRPLEGTITEAQLRNIIEREARLLNLDFGEAVKRAKKGTLPRNPIGDDLSLLVQLLPA